MYQSTKSREGYNSCRFNINLHLIVAKMQNSSLPVQWIHRQISLIYLLGEASLHQTGPLAYRKNFLQKIVRNKAL
jgi:hypothetical protein